LLRNKKQLILMAAFLAAMWQPKRMAEKIACGYFLFAVPAFAGAAVFQRPFWGAQSEKAKCAVRHFWG